MGDSRKNPYLCHKRCFGILRAEGDSLEWKSKGMGAVTIGIPRVWFFF